MSTCENKYTKTKAQHLRNIVNNLKNKIIDRYLQKVTHIISNRKYNDLHLHNFYSSLF